MMIYDMILEARSWVGTPFRWQGRVKGVGVDCVGILVAVLATVGIQDDTLGYSTSTVLLNEIGKRPYLKPVQRHPQAGDIIVFRIRNFLHLGFCTGPSIVQSARRVVMEELLDEVWRHRIETVFEIEP